MCKSIQETREMWRCWQSKGSCWPMSWMATHLRCVGELPTYGSVTPVLSGGTRQHFCKLSTKNSKFLFWFNVRANKKVASLLEDQWNWWGLPHQSSQYCPLHPGGNAHHNHSWKWKKKTHKKNSDKVWNIKFFIYEYFICSCLFITWNKINSSKKYTNYNLVLFYKN